MNTPNDILKNDENFAKNSFEYFEAKYSDIPPEEERIPSKPGYLPDSICEMIVEQVNKVCGIESQKKSMILIAELCQKGGTNSTAGENIVASYFSRPTPPSTPQRPYRVLTASVFKDICTELGRRCKMQITPRQFARTKASEIAYISQKYLRREGDLAYKMRSEVGELSPEDAFWCSNFQSANPDCPPNVRKWLMDDLTKRRRNKKESLEMKQ